MIRPAGAIDANADMARAGCRDRRLWQRRRYSFALFTGCPSKPYTGTADDLAFAVSMMRR